MSRFKGLLSRLIGGRNAATTEAGRDPSSPADAGKLVHTSLPPPGRTDSLELPAHDGPELETSGDRREDLTTAQSDAIELLDGRHGADLTVQSAQPKATSKESPGNEPGTASATVFSSATEPSTATVAARRMAMLESYGGGPLQAVQPSAEPSAALDPRTALETADDNRMAEPAPVRPDFRTTSLADLVGRSETTHGLALSASRYPLFELTSVSEFLEGRPPRAKFLGLEGFGITKFRELWDLASALPESPEAVPVDRASPSPAAPEPMSDPAPSKGPILNDGLREAVGDAVESRSGAARDLPRSGEKAPLDIPAAVEAEGGDEGGNTSPDEAPSGQPSSDLRLTASLAEIAACLGGSVRLVHATHASDLFSAPVANFTGSEAQKAAFLAVHNLGAGTYRELTNLVDRYIEAVARGEDPLGLLGVMHEAAPSESDRRYLLERLSVVPLAMLVGEGDASTRLWDAAAGQVFFERNTVADLLEGRVRYYHLLAATGLEPALAGELRALAVSHARRVPRAPNGTSGSTASADPLAGLTVASLADVDGLPVRIANRMAVEPALRDFPLSRLVRNPEAAAAALSAIDGLGRVSIVKLAELAGAYEAQLRAKALRGAEEADLDSSVLDIRSGRERAGEALDALSDRHRFVLDARYGLTGAPPRRLEEIGERASVTRERVRQVQKKAVHNLGLRPWREAFEALLTEEQAGAWAAVSTGRTYVPEAEASAGSRNLDPMFLLAVDVVHGSVPVWLKAYGTRVDGGWLAPGGSQEDLAAQVRSLRSLLDGFALPRPLADIARAAGLELPVATTALAMIDGIRVHDGYVHRGAIGAKARRVVRMHRLALADAKGIVLDAWRLAVLDANDDHGDERSARAIQTQLAEAPHLFASLYDQYWIALPAHGPWAMENGAIPDPAQGLLSTGFDPESLSAWIHRTLMVEGPLRQVDLRDRAALEMPGISPSSVGPTLLMHPAFHRVAPGVYDVRRDSPMHGSPDLGVSAAMLTSQQARTYARARRSGASRTYFSGWSQSFEWRLCEWARNSADGEVYRSLLAVSDPASWPAPDSVRAEWLRLQMLHGRWSLPVERRGKLGDDPPSPDDFLAGVLHLALLGSIGWIGAARVSQARLGTQGAAEILALLTASGAAVASADWQGPHVATACAPELADRLTAARHATGRLSWDQEPLAGVLNDALGKPDAVTWAETSEVLALLGALQKPGPVVAASPTPAGALAEVEDLFASAEWDDIFSG